MAENINNDTKDIKESDTTTDNNEYEEVCYICRRPESVAGKLLKIQDSICICTDCMQKTFDSMSNGGLGGLNMNDMMNMGFGKMPNISMINLADLQGGVPQS